MNRLHHVRAGRGRPLVLIHGGLGLDHTYLRALSPLSDHRELVWIDLPGHGGSPAPARWSDVDLDSLADDLDALRRELGHDRWTVVGHSYGGFIAMTYALRHPAATASLGLLGAGPSFAHAPSVLSDLDRRDQPDAARELLAAIGHPSSDDAHLARIWPLVLPLYYHRWHAGHLAHFADVRFSSAGYNRGNDLLPTLDLTPSLSSIRAPTLIVAGDDDFIMPVAAAATPLAAGIPNARLTIIPAAGHYMFHEAPAAVVAALADL